MNRISHKYFRGGKVHKTFLLGFCIFAFVLFRVFWYRTFYIINEVEFTVWKTYKYGHENEMYKEPMNLKRGKGVYMRELRECGGRTEDKTKCAKG